MTPAALQVLLARLAGIAGEMGAVLRRAAFSPNIRERADCSAAVFSASGELLAQAEHIPVHLGSMPASVRAAIAVAGAPEPDRHVVVNDPFAGGTHLNDITVVTPCFAGGALVGWVANRAHHADVGGMVPGSIPPDATTIVQEGLRIPPMVLTPEVVALVRANSRTPVERAGDLDAQIGANRVGASRLALLDPSDFDTVLEYGERRMRAALRSLPDGTWTADDVVDSTGPRPDQQRPARIVVRVTKVAAAIEFDFSGTDDQRDGNVNAVAAVTTSAVAWSVRSVTDPTIPANGGALRPVRVLTTPGSIVDAQPPAAVGAGNVEVSQRIADVCLAALAGLAPARVPAAGQGTMNNLVVGGRGWVYYETVGGGQGGRPGPGLDGMSGVHTGMTNTRDTPVEALERAYPMRVRRYGLREGSGGDGRARGGEGIVRELQVLEACVASLITERRASSPWGLAGGEPGANGENWLVRADGSVSRLPDKCTVTLEAGDAIRQLTPGGGGWGPPPEPLIR